MIVENRVCSITEDIVTLTAEQDPAAVRACVEDSARDTQLRNIVIKRIRLNIDTQD